MRNGECHSAQEDARCAAVVHSRNVLHFEVNSGMLNEEARAQGVPLGVWHSVEVGIAESIAGGLVFERQLCAGKLMIERIANITVVVNFGVSGLPFDA